MPVIKLNNSDNVVTAVEFIPKGTILNVKPEPNGNKKIVALNDIDFGHKIAVTPILKGDDIVKYGVSIGTAVRDIKKGEHVHIHNLKDHSRDREEIAK